MTSLHLVFSESTKVRNLSVALTVVCVTMVSEYFFRHYVMFWFPTIGELGVNDMISLLIVYALLMLVFGYATHTDWKRELRGIGHSLQDLAKTWEYVPWLLLMALISVLLPLDRLLWGGVKLMPWLTSSYQDPVKWFAGQAPFIKAIAFLAVNGLFVPVAEEYLWRGIVQERLLHILPAPLAIGITAVLFSFKHVLVDDSFGRFLFIIAFGVICGIVAQQKNWRASASVHLVINTIGTIVALVTGLL